MKRAEKVAIFKEIGMILDKCRRCYYGPKSANKFCAACDTLCELQLLGEKVNDGRLGTYADEILAKGPEMTRSDMVKLIKMGVEKQHMAKALGMSKNSFEKMCTRLGLTLNQMVAAGEIERARGRLIREHGASW